MTPGAEGHVTSDALIDYFAGDLPASEEADVETHLMTCSACTADAERVAAVTEGIRRLLPPLATPSLLAALRSRGVRIEENLMAPGEEKEVVLGPHLDLLVHRLGGIGRNATHVEFSLRVAETGRIVLHLDRVPVDAESGDVLLLCHKHYAGLPPNLIASVRSLDPSGNESTSEYTIRHHFLPG
jgi:hypothetical protein